MYNKKTIKIIIFDGNQILYNTKPSSIEFNRLFTEFLKLHNSKFDLAYANIIWSDLHKAALKGKISESEVKNEYLSKLGLSQYVKEYEDINEISLKKATLYDQTGPSTLKNLKNQYKLAVLSDTARQPNQLRNFLDSIGFEGIFDHIFTSSSIHFVKPDPESYQSVLNFYSVAPKEALFIGHDIDELEGAEKIGINILAYGINYKNSIQIKYLSELLNLL